MFQLSTSIDFLMSGDEVTSILVAHQGSHAFTDRECIVPDKDDKLKIGRAVAKLKQATDNFIFECKVLSRNHALLWREGDKFYLQDTKSSNGTYVNNERLSACNEESEPREIFSGDVLQFGVDVTDNQKKVTHGCIIASLHLVKDGMEMGRPVSTIDRTVAGRLGDSVSTKDCKELMKILSHAIHREQEMEAKLSNLDQVIVQTQNLVGEEMKAKIHEDQLIARIEAMEHQIKMYAQDYKETDLKTHLADSYRSKLDLESFTKEKLHEYYQKLVEGSAKLQETTKDYNKAQEEYGNLRTIYEKLSADFDTMRTANRKQQVEIKEFQERLDHLEAERERLSYKYQEDCQELKDQIEQLVEVRDGLQQDKDEALENSSRQEKGLEAQTQVVLSQQTELSERETELGKKEKELIALTRSQSEARENAEQLTLCLSQNISELSVSRAVTAYIEQEREDAGNTGEAVMVLRERLETVQSQLATTEGNYGRLVQDLEATNRMRARREKSYQQQQIGMLVLAICLLVVIVSYLVGALL